MSAVDSMHEAAPLVGTVGWIESLAFTPRKESWVASSSGWFYKIFRASDDPARDWRNPVCIETATREYVDTLFLHHLSDRVCAPVRRDHACVVYPHLSGPDMRAMLQQRDTVHPHQCSAGLREAMVLLARLHASSEGADYPVKDYLHNGYLVPDAGVSERIIDRDRTLFIGGFEVRNFRFDRRHNGWFFFDPQHVVRGMPEDDVARFIISLLMINWGKGGSLKLWQDFDANDLLSTYEQATARSLDRTLLNYFLRETVAMRRHFAEKSLRSLSRAKRIPGRPYLAIYFLQLQQWVENHEF